MALTIAAIGDVHGFWNDFDVAYFNKSDYDMLLFVGDLAEFTNATPTARRMAGLEVPALVIPGNHDAVGTLQFLAELRDWPRPAGIMTLGAHYRHARLKRALGDVQLAGFSLHNLQEQGFGLSLIAGRPHSMGGDRFYYQALIKRLYGVTDYQSSVKKMCSLVDQAEDSIIFFAHNGPAGLGDRPEDPWGCDFNLDNGDFGDSDLAEAVNYAKKSGRRVVAVVAGHMHRRMKKSRGRRFPAAWRDGCGYINAAEVPRILNDQQGNVHHHVALTVTSDSIDVEDVWVSDSGGISRKSL